ncbi:MAG: HD domain-containing protein [Weeping tea tree witches'-broom phytoplasma]|uniref:HD domain-containing protein n=1 Tax=Candidatus Phytoplasma melaleucae TaxID=2982630 RepID=UPI00293AAE20|nr:HD domain-containing protein [Weeping tea tree witches'-broom phytoplasma]
MCRNSFKEIIKFAKSEVFRDPIYGYIFFDYVFLEELINTSFFQRLRRIRQLGCVNIVFPGAEHSRFTHSLGVYELARRFLENNRFQLAKAMVFSFRDELILLVSALLHDVGHGSYSHVFERIFNTKHEDKSVQIIMHDPEITSILDKIDNDFKKDVASVIRKEQNGKFQLIKQLLASQLDFDRLDYLKRDSFFTGVSYGHIDSDRLIRIMDIETQGQEPRIVFRKSGISSIENYLINRYHMYRQVYCHTKIIAFSIVLEKILARLIFLVKKNYCFNTDIIWPLKEFLYDKYNLNTYMRMDDFYINSLIIYFQNSDDSVLSSLCKDFLNRRIWKCIENNFLNHKIINKIKNFYGINVDYYTSYYNDSIARDAYYENKNNVLEQILVLSYSSTGFKVQSLSKESLILRTLMSLHLHKGEQNFFYFREY